MDDIEKIIASLNKTHPLIPHTNAGRLSSTVRRMKAEKELGIPFNLRTGFVYSVGDEKAADQLDAERWEELFASLSNDLKEQYPKLSASVFCLE